jgi:hypothetical protein
MADDQSRQLITVLASSTTVAEKAALLAWATQLLEIRGSLLSPTQKVREALTITAKGAVVWPAVKILSREFKRIGWNDRSLAGRFGMAGAAVGAAVFGGQGAGIAALGTAIGIPLWVVIGSGAAFAGTLIEEFARRDH